MKFDLADSMSTTLTWFSDLRSQLPLLRHNDGLAPSMDSARKYEKFEMNEIKR